MKVIFANGSLGKLKYLALSEDSGSGFLKTERIGRYIFITDLIHGNLCEDSGKKDLINIYDLWGSKFGGVFLNEELELPEECFLEKLILVINKNNYLISYFDSELMRKTKIREGSFDNN